MSAAAVDNNESTLTSSDNQINHESRHHNHSSSSSSSFRGLPLLDISSLGGAQPHHHRPIPQPHTALSASALSPLASSNHHHHSNLAAATPIISSHLGFASSGHLAPPLSGTGSGDASTSSTPSCLGSPIPATPVKETNYINVDYDPVSGRKLVNTYEIIRELGRGQHGKVKLARDLITGDLVAIKVVDRTSRPRLGRPQGQGSSQEEKVRREIAILKKCIHPNIVRLREVLDDSSSKKIFLVLEYCEKGEVGWQTEDGKPLQTVESARSIFREVLLGVEYLHCQGIIHRDIKPANLLVSKDDVVKISDFGVSYLAGTDDDDLELAKTAGTPAFFAPEVCHEDPNKPRPKITEKIDIWALGVTLYCLVYGCLPFVGDNEFELFHHIATEPLTFPEDGPQDVQDLLRKLLKKDPTERMNIQEIKQHHWVCEGLSSEELQYFEQQMPESISRIQVSHEEVEHAVVGFTSRIRRGLSKLSSTALQIAGIRRRPSSSTTAASKSRTRSGSNRYSANSNCASPQSQSRSPSAARSSSYRLSPSSHGADLSDYVRASFQEQRSRSGSLANHSTLVNAQDSAETLRPPLKSSPSAGLPISHVRRPSASSTGSTGRGALLQRRRTSTGSEDYGPEPGDGNSLRYSKYPHPASITTAMLYHNHQQQPISSQTRQARSSENLHDSATPSSSVGSTSPEWLNAVRNSINRSGSRHKVTERGPLRPRARAASNQSSNAVFSFSDSDHELSEDTDDVSSLSMSVEDEPGDGPESSLGKASPLPSPQPGSSPNVGGGLGSAGGGGLLKVPLVGIPELRSSDAAPLDCEGDGCGGADPSSQLEKRAISTSSVVSSSSRAKRSNSGSSSNYKSGSNGNNSFVSAGSSKEALLRKKLKELELKSAANSDNESSDDDDDDGDLVLVVENRRSRANTVNEQQR